MPVVEKITSPDHLEAEAWHVALRKLMRINEKMVSIIAGLVAKLLLSSTRGSE
jgi:hypothetical protein